MVKARAHKSLFSSARHGAGFAHTRSKLPKRHYRPRIYYTRRKNYMGYERTRSRQRGGPRVRAL